MNHPDPIPDGWFPPPLKQVKTIIITNESKVILFETKTDSTGSVCIYNLVEGTYYFGLKESPFQFLVGPIDYKSTTGDYNSVSVF